MQSYTLIRHGFIHKLLPIPYSFSSYDITISSTFQCITGETNGGRQRNVLNREREYGTMRYRRGMVTGRDFKKRGCREDSCIILFAPLFVPLSKLARANAICESQHEESGGEIMKSDIDYIKIASFNRNAYVGRSKSLNTGTIFFFSLVFGSFS